MERPIDIHPPRGGRVECDRSPRAPSFSVGTVGGVDVGEQATAMTADTTASCDGDPGEKERSQLQDRFSDRQPPNSVSCVILDKTHESPLGRGGDEEGTSPVGKPATRQEERTVAWLSLRKDAAESRCRELEIELAQALDTTSKQTTSLRVAHEKIRHLEKESKGLLEAAEFREKQAFSMQEGASLAEERAHAHGKALASALEQLTDSGVSQSKKLVELAGVHEDLKRTKSALQRAEGVVFEQRQAADERQSEHARRKAEMDALREKVAQLERKNTELMAKHAAGRLAKRVRGNFGRSSTFCASFCSCLRKKPTYRRVSSPAPLPAQPGVPASPWLA